MEKNIRKNDIVFRSIRDILVDLPSPRRISYIWNFGSLLGLFLLFQVVTGLFLSIHFSGDVELSFFSVVHIIRDVNSGWFVRVLHSNGARIFFILLYLHIGRGLYYGSYRFKKTWIRGVTIFLLSIATAFLGYVLPWGQMSFWAATVITNLLSAVPYVGKVMVEWLWGGFAVGNPTLTRFFAFHFILPFIIIVVVGLHLVFLHERGSNNPLGVWRDSDKISFHPLFRIKDTVGLGLIVFFLIYISLVYPFVFIDSENFIPSNPLVTPVHIQPEWYFLFAYTILRSIPRKLGGVVALVASVVILYLIPFILNQRGGRLRFYVGGRVIFWIVVGNWFLLTWIGAREVEEPFRELGGGFSLIYFLLYFFLWINVEVQDKVIGWFYKFLFWKQSLRNFL